MRPEQKLWLATISLAVCDYLGAKLRKADPYVNAEAVAFLDYHYPVLMTRLRSIRGKKAMRKLLDEIETNLEELNG